MEAAECRCPQHNCSEDFPNSYRNYVVEPIFSKVNDLASAAFLKMNSPTNTLFGILQNPLNNYL